MFTSYDVGTEGLFLNHFLNNYYTEVHQAIKDSLVSSRYGNAFTLLHSVRTFANSQQTIREWCQVNNLQKTVVEKFLSDIIESLGTDEEETGHITLNAVQSNLKKDTDTVDNILLQILCSHFHNQVYVRHISTGMQRFIRLSNGNVTYRHDQLDTDGFVVCSRYHHLPSTPTINSNHLVIVPMELLMNVLRAKDFSNVIENVTKNVSGILLHKRSTYLETMRR